MKRSEFLNNLTIFILKSDDDSKEWAENPRLVLLFKVFIIIFLVLMLIKLLMPITPLNDYLKNSESAVLTLRIFHLLSMTLCAIWLFCVSYEYYSFITKKKGNFDIRSITFLYLVNLVIFSLIYTVYFQISPDSFIVTNVEYVPQKTARGTDFILFKFQFDMIIFSALTSVARDYYKIKINSQLLSIISYFQILHVLAIISFFIATYTSQHVNRSTPIKKYKSRRTIKKTE